MVGSPAKTARKPRLRASASSSEPGSVIAANDSARPPAQVPEEVEVAASLERRARLGGDEEERARRVERVGRAADGRGMGRVQDLQVVALERAPEHLGREARPAHAEKDDRVELAHGAGGELLELGHALAHAKRLVEPAEPAVLVAPGPERGVASPEALDQLGGRERGQAPSGRDELARLRANALEELREGVGELLDTLALEGVGHVVVVDAGLLEVGEELLRLVDPLLEGRAPPCRGPGRPGSSPRASCSRSRARSAPRRT